MPQSNADRPTSAIQSPAARLRTCARVALVVLLPMTVGCRDAEHDAESEAATHASQVAATTIRADTSTYADVVDAAGIIAARPGGEASLAAPAATRVDRVLVAVGERVTAGTVLVEFEPVLFDAALTSAESARQAAEQAQARAERLVAAGVVPRRDLEQANASLQSARAAALAARRTRELTTLRSPIAGVVTRVSAVRGANVNEQQPLVDIADPDKVDAVLQLSPDAAKHIRVGQTVEFRPSAASGAAAVGTGRVTDISAVVDGGTHSVAVRASMVPTSGTLRLGESIFGSIIAETHPGAVVIPDLALVPHEEGFRVFVVDSAGVAHTRAVSVGGRSAQGVWIRSGVRRGEMVVTIGAYGLDDGSIVVPAAKKP